MPLFGSKNNNVDGTTTTGHHGHTGPGPVIGGAAGGLAGHEVGHGGLGTAAGAAAGEHHAHTHPAGYNNAGGYDNNTTTGHHGHTGPGPVMGGAAGGLAGHEVGHGGLGAAAGVAAGEHHAHHHPAGTAAGTGAGTGAGYGGTGAGVGAGTGTGGGSATEKKIVGKLEQAAGTALCSSTLRAKGIEKEREAEALKVQAAELGQAEGLETEAAARRERAVAHGAHPGHLNGGNAARAPANNVGGNVVSHGGVGTGLM